MIKYLITVRLPEESRIFQTNYFSIREGRVLFEDKNGNPKNFPEQDCFIEGVGEWLLQQKSTIKFITQQK